MVAPSGDGFDSDLIIRLSGADDRVLESRRRAGLDRRDPDVISLPGDDPDRPVDVLEADA